MIDKKPYFTHYLNAQTSQIDCFRSVHKILRRNGFSDFKFKFGVDISYSKGDNKIVFIYGIVIILQMLSMNYYQINE